MTFPSKKADFTFKKGASFVANCQYEELGVAAALPVGMTVESRVRTLEGKLVSLLTYEAGSGGAYVLRDNSTTDWPLGLLVWDIKYVLGAVITKTENLYFELVPGPT